ncbi:MAG: DUF4397 domain-containing protein [Gemmatimonadaceae bacterium]|nr:DUF4397 domain-containing protein [Gemmatimonadaceae bacterium]
MTATMNRYGSLAVLLCAAALTACDYDKNAVQDITAPSVPEARVKFFNFGISAPAVVFYADETKLTAINFTGCSTAAARETEPCTTTGNESTGGVGYGGVAAGGLYAGIDPGQHTLSGRITATTDKGLAISNVTTTLAAGMKYSFYQSGPYSSTTKTVDAFVVEDPFPDEIDWSNASVRFVHAVYNANPMTLYAKDDSTGVEVAVGGTTAYKSAGAFTTLPPGIYDLSTRYDGSGTNVITRSNVSFAIGRTYTITARGNITVTPTTTGCAAANMTCLDNTLNR